MQNNNEDKIEKQCLEKLCIPSLLLTTSHCLQCEHLHKSRSFHSLLLWSTQVNANTKPRWKDNSNGTRKASVAVHQSWKHFIHFSFPSQTLQASVSMLNVKVHDRTVRKRPKDYGLFGRVEGEYFTSG
ncbi:hypothetical protein AMECASPLE_005838 [Ameca splendens]|uniref:Uncharacterized protein n=1 Tax=Ameca splendens TaxID=208324 RepID=A0ABV0YXZ4_9TELE